LQDNVAAGMQRWRAAVSSTTMLLMERRMDAAAALNPAADSGTSMAPLGVPDASTAQQNGQQADAQQQPDSAGSGGNVVAGQQLQLLELLGQGSFGSVFLAVWRGKRVAVKMMQLPASALLDPGDQLSTDHQLSPGQQQQRPHTEAESVAERRRRLQRQKQQNSPPHMAIMEAVVSSAMTHPNVSGLLGVFMWQP
jgi:serine/threonine protein kinase